MVRDRLYGWWVLMPARVRSRRPLVEMVFDSLGSYYLLNSTYVQPVVFSVSLGWGVTRSYTVCAGSVVAGSCYLRNSFASGHESVACIAEGLWWLSQIKMRRVRPQFQGPHQAKRAGDSQLPKKPSMSLDRPEHRRLSRVRDRPHPPVAEGRRRLAGQYAMANG